MLEYFLLIIGIVFLLKGAELLIDGSTSLASKLGISKLIIGLTIVALGTSMPEVFVNIFAAINKTAEISFGNIIGSNLSNTLLILGISAIIHPIKVHSNTTWKEIPFALLAALVFFVLSNKSLLNLSNGKELVRSDGVILLLFLIAFLYYIFDMVRKGRMQKDIRVDIKRHNATTITLMIIGGSLLLYFGGRWVVDGAVYAAAQLGLSKFLLSSTIVAVGTSLPEFTTVVMASFKRESDLIVGDIVGSNIFNIFLVMAIPPLINPTPIPEFINPDFMFLILSSTLLFLFMFAGKRHMLERWKGITFLALYLLYLNFIIMRG